MRVSIILLLNLISFTLKAAPEDKSIGDLFQKYDQIMLEHKTEMIEEVFTKNFLEGNGGKEDFIKKVKSEPILNEKSRPTMKLSWRKGVMGKMYFAKLKDTSKIISPKDEGGSEFIIVEENGKLKIDGTLSDAE